MPQKSQPMGLVGRREAISAPTVGNASQSTPVSTAKPSPGLSPRSSGGRGTSPVRKSSERASPMSATQTAHNDLANQAAVRPLILPTPRSSSLAPSATTPLYSTTVSQALRQPLRGKGLNNIDPHHRPRGYGGGPEDVEVGDTSLLTSFSIDGEYTSDTLSEPRG